MSAEPSSLAALTEQETLCGRVMGGKYQILELTGVGAMGSVYRARQLALQKIVAVKVLHRELEKNAAYVDRFQVEAHAASRLDHPSSTRVLDFGAEPDGLLYIVMEFLEGRTLGDILERESPLPAPRVTSILLQVLSALSVAHGMGILHRDLKPENIMVLPGVGDDGEHIDQVKVCDFGIAKLTSVPDTAGPPYDAGLLRSSSILPRRPTQETIAGVVVGTPAYMSPEQARSSPLDARTDIYSLGVVLYEMLSGRLPFEADNAMALVGLQASGEPVPIDEAAPSADPLLRAICQRAMAKERTDRYASAREMRTALRALPPASRDAAPPPPSALPLPPGGSSEGLARTLAEGVPSKGPSVETAAPVAAPTERDDAPRSAAIPVRQRPLLLAAAASLALGAWLVWSNGPWAIATRGASAPAPTASVAEPPAAAQVAPSAAAPGESLASPAALPERVASPVPSAAGRGSTPAPGSAGRDHVPEPPRPAAAPPLVEIAATSTSPTAHAAPAPSAPEPPTTTPAPATILLASASASASASARVTDPPAASPAPVEPAAAVAFDGSRGRVLVRQITAERIPRRAVSDVLKRADLEGCYRAALRARGSAGSPSAVLHLEFDQMVVSGIQVTSPLPLPRMAECIHARLASVRVGDADTGGASAAIDLDLVAAP